MLIVLEGLPGAGKTSALRQLQNDEDVRVIDEIIGEEPKGATEDFFVQNDIRKYRLVNDDEVSVMDRNFVSTLCYNYCLDKRFGTDNFSRIDKAIKNSLEQGRVRHPDLYIVLLCSTTTSKDRQNKTNDTNWADEEFLRSAQEFYTDYFAHLSSPILTINTDQSDSSETIEKIRNAVATATSRPRAKRRTYA